MLTYPVITSHDLTALIGEQLTAQEIAQLRARIPRSSIRDVLADLASDIIGQRIRHLAAALPPDPPPADLHASLPHAPTEHSVDRVLRHLSQRYGQRFVSVWTHYDGLQFTGTPRLCLHDLDRERLYDLDSGLVAWLFGQASDPPPTPEWIADPVDEFLPADLPATDGLHHFAIHGPDHQTPTGTPLLGMYTTRRPRPFTVDDDALHRMLTAHATRKLHLLIPGFTGRTPGAALEDLVTTAVENEVLTGDPSLQLYVRVIDGEVGPSYCLTLHDRHPALIQIPISDRWRMLPFAPLTTSPAVAVRHYLQWIATDANTLLVAIPHPEP